jgi:hypothetical protein
MKSSLAPRLANSLLRKLSQFLDARSHLIDSELRGSGLLLLLPLRPVDEGRVQPLLIPIGSRRRRA